MNQSVDLVNHGEAESPDNESAMNLKTAVYGNYELKAQVLFPSIKNPPIVSAVVKSDEPEIKETDEAPLKVSVKPLKEPKKDDKKSIR